MNEIPFTDKQRQTVAEYNTAVLRLQEQQAAYLRGVLESHERIDPKDNYTLKPDGTGLVKVQIPPPSLQSVAGEAHHIAQRQQNLAATEAA